MSSYRERKVTNLGNLVRFAWRADHYGNRCLRVENREEILLHRAQNILRGDVPVGFQEVTIVILIHTFQGLVDERHQRLRC
jgi:hypothetical protein